MKRVAILGSTGSIGQSALAVVDAHPDRLQVVGLAAGENVELFAAQIQGVALLPVDSEHNAIHQCLHGRAATEIRKLILTASGGPFRGRSAADLQDVTAADALKHPTWRMGRKITIDSATLMNKGL